MTPQQGHAANQPALMPWRKRRRKPVFGHVHWNALILACAIQGVVAEDDYESESVVDAWYDLVRYLVGMGLCIFCLINFYFHQYASYKFVKRYTEPNETEKRVGRVVACEPLLSSTSIYSQKEKIRKMRKKKDKHHEVSVQTFKGEMDGMSATSYVREEDLESCHSKSGELAEYRVLFVYTVPIQSSNNFLCCGPLEKEDLPINFTDSFGVGTCASGISDLSEDNSVYQKISLYRSRSLPSSLEKDTSLDDMREQIRDNFEIMKLNECEYFQYFVTRTPKPIDTKVDLLLLNGQPKSACTPEVLTSHLEQIGKQHEGEGESCCESISLLGMGLAVSIIVLFLVSFYEIQAMPNPETQRPLGYSVLGTICVGSTVFGYLFARLLFEQYKQKVFLSAFTVPIGRGYIDKTVSEDTNIIDEEFFAQMQIQRGL